MVSRHKDNAASFKLSPLCKYKELSRNRFNLNMYADGWIQTEKQKCQVVLTQVREICLSHYILKWYPK
jgi:hypothetical protein